MRQTFALLLFCVSGYGQEKTAEQAYKNIQALQGIPASGMTQAMAFISGSLGVSCSHCHIVGQFDKDEKPAKETARQMIRMMQRINQEHFGGKTTVNCQTCHQGRLRPVAIPTIASGDAPPRSEPSPTLPSADQVLDRYVDAVGGRAAIEKISTRISKGTFQGPGVRATVERIQKTPARLLIIVQFPKGTSSFGVNGSRGWEKGPGSAPAREAPPDDENVAPFQWDADLHRDLKLRELYTKVSVTTQETIGSVSAWVVEAESRRGQTEKLYFDSQTGLLLRRLQIRGSPLGPLPLQMDFGDYREVDGVKVPFFSRWARPDVTLTFQYDEVRHNLPVEDARFEKP
jgi:photosynthetic reaction center cytochrome c subunit